MIYYRVCIWFLVIILFFSIFFIYIGISNCIEYKKIINKGGTDDISSDRANFLYVSNIILSGISCFIILWIIYIWIYTEKKRNEKLKNSN